MPKDSASILKAKEGKKVLAAFLPYLLLIFLVFLVLSTITPYLQEAPSTDSSVFLYMGQRILKGEVPYRDVWDHKGPLIYYLDALGLAMGGSSRWGVWLLEFIAVGAAACLGFTLFRRAFGAWTALFSSALFVLELRFVLDKGNLVEEYALPLQFLLLWCFWLAATKRRWKYYFSLGVIAGLCVLMRPNSLGILLAIGTYMVIQVIRSKEEKGYWKLILASVLGGAAIVGLFALYMLAVKAWPSFWDQVVIFNLAYSQEGSGNWADALLSGLSLLPISTMFGTAGWVLVLGVYGKQRRTLSESEALAAIGLVALPVEVILTILPGRAFPHYFMSWLPILALLTAFLLHFLFQMSSQNERAIPKRGFVYQFVALGLLLGITAAPVLQLLPSAGSNVEAVMVAGGLPLPSMAGHRYQPLLEYIRENVPADQPIMVWGNQATINWLTDREAPTRFVYQTPLFVPGYRSREKTNAVIAELEESPPVIIDTGGFLPSLGVRLDRIPQEVRPLYRYFQEHYNYAGTFELLGWDLYLYHGNGVPLESQ